MTPPRSPASGLAVVLLTTMALLSCPCPAQSDGGAPPPVDARATALDRRVMAALPGRHDTAHARLHYDPAAVSDAQRDAAAADIESCFGALERLLDMRFEGRILVFLYRDVADLRRRTGAGDGAVAFSTGTVSLHQPHDFRGEHELTHLFALQFPRDRDAFSDPFVVEGLATILAKHDQGVPIHDWATVYLRAGRLPDLLALRRTFPDGAPDGVHPYHVAGSFVGFLIDRFGMAKVKGYYVNATEAQHWFGAPARALEREWRAWLRGREVAPAHRAHVLRHLGLPDRALPAAVRDGEGTDLLAGATLDALEADDDRGWSFDGGVLRGDHDGPWTHLTSRRAFGPRVAVRARVRVLRGDAVKLLCNRGERANEAIFARWGAFLTAGGGYAKSERLKLEPGVLYDLVLVHDGGVCTVFRDGVAVFEAEGAPSDVAGPVGIAVEKGAVEVAALEVFAW